jgi:hypothetical protein
MSKRKLGLLLTGAYVLGLAMLAAGALVVLPAFPRAHAAVRQFPGNAQRAARIGQVAVRAGALGLKHLPATLESQGLRSGRPAIRLCKLDGSTPCASKLIRIRNLLPALAPMRIVVDDDEG